ncbi:MBL fold metallo-hydrolase [Riemerella columbina]|uniref:MBL fold metallo-hydrolase n=1 Tax=Riemerella columbina TaxID=103810 RepID=UPI00266FEC07|nr:MBL fold metallo-hydrolase [Riemerella columbina]WKS95881.1 MBL fold metallo-hydrolase [Riemerella columbina]
MSLQVIKSKIGNAEILQIVECEIGEMVNALLPDATPENVKTIEWLKPPYRTENFGLAANSQCFIVKINSRILVVDTCIGNDKNLIDVPAWQFFQFKFIETLEAIGLDRNAVTDVLCTHLHIDHIGWNTYLKDGKWHPTFPNAKYHFAKDEYNYWKDYSKNDTATAIAYEESITPVVDAKLVNYIATDENLGDGISVFPTPGHTHSHISVKIEAGDETFIIGGDMAHHPCQFAHPEWSLSADADQKQPAKTRRKVFAELSGTPVLFAGSHFKSPSFGLITKDENGEFIFNGISKEINQDK